MYVLLAELHASYLVLDVLLRPFSDGRETPSLCCQNGKVRLWPLPASPDPLLLDYVRRDTAQSRAFLANIRRIKSPFSFTPTGSSLGVLLRQVGFAHGPPTFVIQEAFHHYLSSPMPQAGHHPRYAEIYCYSAEEKQLRHRLNSFEELSIFIFFIFSSSGGWGKIKLELTTLPRIFIRVVCRFNSVAFAAQR